MNRRFAFAFLAAALPAGLSAPARVSAEDSPGARVYKQTLKSVVWVINVFPQKGSYATGSGSLIDYKDGLVVTNYHVVTESKVVTIMFPLHDPQGNLVTDRDKYMAAVQKNGGYRGTVLFAEKKRDLAIVKIDRRKGYPEGTVAIELAETQPTPGDAVHSVGSPGASAGLFSYTPGMCRTVTGKKWVAGDPNDGGFEVDCKIVETTSPTNHGDSGGPLLNDKGQQIGVTEGGANALAANAVSFFIDISEVRAILKEHRIALNKYRGPGTNTGDESAEHEIKSSDSTSGPKPNAEGDKPKDGKVETKPLKQGASAEDEKKAARELAMAKSLNDSGKKDLALKHLAKILTDYPTSSVAREAREMAKEIDK